MKHGVTAARLSEAMNSANLKPVELSEKSGVSQASISQYLNGSHAPSNLSSGKMAKVLRCNPVWLMGFDVPMNSTEQPHHLFSPAKSLMDITGDVEMMKAIDTYLSLSDEQKKHVIDTIYLLGKQK